jgi:hypothetical protein
MAKTKAAKKKAATTEKRRGYKACPQCAKQIAARSNSCDCGWIKPEGEKKPSKRRAAASDAGLIAAVKFVRTCGGLDAAKASLKTLEKIKAM